VNVYTSNKVSEIIDKEWPYNLNFGRGLTNYKARLATKSYIRPQTWTNPLEERKTDMSFRIQI
jgi:hypothetical protein